MYSDTVQSWINYVYLKGQLEIKNKQQQKPYYLLLWYLRGRTQGLLHASALPLGCVLSLGDASASGTIDESALELLSSAASAQSIHRLCECAHMAQFQPRFINKNRQWVTFGLWAIIC